MPLRIYKRGEVWHYRGTVARIRLHGSCRTTDKRLAQRIAAEREALEWRCHLDGPESVVTMGQAIVAYLDAEKPTRFIARVAAYWKDTPLKNITPESIRQSARVLFPNGSGATRNRQAIVPTQAIINHAAELGWCSKISVKRFPVETKAKRPVTAEWIEAFTAHASPHLGALALFMFGTGARITEAVSLKWADVDLSNRRATIRQTKIGDTRTAHLPPPVLAKMANLPRRDPVFGYADRGSVKDPWAVACRRAGIEHLTPHCCRHGFATSLLQAGVDVKTVAKLGGWKDAGTVLRTYAHAMDDPTVPDVIFTPSAPHGNAARGITSYSKTRKN